MYIAISTTGLEPSSALAAFEDLENVARWAILNAGGCLSHHHGVPWAKRLERLFGVKSLEVFNRFEVFFLGSNQEDQTSR